MLRRSLACVAVVAMALGGCAGLNARQQAGWTAFHGCQPVAPSAAMEDLLQSGRVSYRTQEGREFSSMKACMEERGYSCDLGVTIGSRPHTHCHPRAGRG